MQTMTCSAKTVQLGRAPEEAARILEQVAKERGQQKLF